MNIEQAKTIPLSVILDKMNRVPTKEKGRDVWYLSPFRNEQGASFKINLHKNTWYDFGIGKGGDIIDLIRGYLEAENENFEVKDALRWARNMTGFIPRIQPVPVEDFKEEDSTLVLRKIGPIKRLGLIKYGESRGITSPVLTKYMEEVTIYNRKTDKTFFSLGMENESKGYELRNPFFKGCVRKKDFTFIRGEKPKPPGVHLFEGCMDFLSVATQKEGKPFDDDVIVLHSLNCMDHASAFIRNYGYEFCYTWMDNDEPGQKATSAWQDFCKNEEGLTHVPMNAGYEAYIDVNAHHMSELGL